MFPFTRLTLRRWALVFLLLTTAAVLAPPRAEAQVRTDEDVRALSGEEARSPGKDGAFGPARPWALLLRMLAALAFVLALVVLAAYLLRRFAPRSAAAAASRSDAIRVVATKMLGGRRSLMLVRVRGQTLLLGVTPQSIECLTEIHEVEGDWAQPPEGGESGRRSAFGQQLGRFIDRRIAESPSESSQRPS
jgi:flagellar biosynthetic protein FliO